jgi:RNA polymerase sigma-70 factor (ECF subfamily)
MTKPTPPHPISFVRYREYLRSLAEARVGTRLRGQIDPSDIVQETLLKAHRGRDQFRGESEQQLIAWLGAILNNTLTNALRSCFRRDGFVSVRLSEAPDSASAARGVVPIDCRPSPDQIAMQNEQLLQLARELAWLPDEQRAVLEMKFLQCLTVAEIADVTGRSKASVVGLVYRGMKALRARMNSAGRGTGPYGLAAD